MFVIIGKERFEPVRGVFAYVDIAAAREVEQMKRHSRPNISVLEAPSAEIKFQK
jgi:hypothetical protein